MNYTSMILACDVIKKSYSELNDIFSMERGHKTKVEWRYGGCHACMGSPCPVKVKLVDGKVVKVEGQKIPLLDGRLCAKGHAIIDQLYSQNRLKYPLKRIGKKGDGKFKRISWDEALSEVAMVLKRYRDEGHPEYVAMVYGCGHWGNIPLYNYFSKVYGTPNFSHHHGDACNASGSAASVISGLRSCFPDYGNSRYILEISHNPLGGGTAPIHFSIGTFNEAIRKNTKILVVDPRLSETAAVLKAEWIPIKPGTDSALLLGLIHILLTEQLYNREFLLRYTNAPILIKPNGDPLKDKKNNFLVWDNSLKDLRPLNKSTEPSLKGSLKNESKTVFQLLKERSKRYTPKKVEDITTIPKEKILEMARDIGAAKPAVSINWNAAHSSFHTNSMQTWRLKHILAMVLGSYDVLGGMILKELDNVACFLSGKSETPSILPTVTPPVKTTKLVEKLSIEKSADSFRYSLHDAIPKFYQKAILEGVPYPLKAMIVYGNSLLNSHTNVEGYRKALEKEELFLVVIDIWPNDHVDYADIVLPDACSLNRLEVFTELWDNRMRVVVPLLPIIEPLHDAKDVSEIYIALARKMGLEEYFDFTKETWFNTQIKPLGIDLDYLRKNGVYFEKHEPIYERFPYKIKPRTPTERLEIYSTKEEVLKLFNVSGDPHADPLPDYIPLDIGEPKTENEFYLLSTKCAILQKSTSQNNSYLMDDNIDQIGLTKLWINSDRARHLEIRDNDLVKIWSEITGAEAVIRVRVTEGIHPTSVFTFAGFGQKAKLMSNGKGKEGINVNEFIPDHIELLSGASATQDSLIKIERMGR